MTSMATPTNGNKARKARSLGIKIDEYETVIEVGGEVRARIVSGGITSKSTRSHDGTRTSDEFSVHGQYGLVGAHLEYKSASQQQKDGSQTKTTSSSLSVGITPGGFDAANASIGKQRRKTTSPEGIVTTEERANLSVSVLGQPVLDLEAPVDPVPTMRNEWDDWVTTDQTSYTNPTSSTLSPTTTTTPSPTTPSPSTERFVRENVDLFWQPDPVRTTERYGDAPPAPGDVDPADYGLPSRGAAPGSYGYGDGPDQLLAERIAQAHARTPGQPTGNPLRDPQTLNPDPDNDGDEREVWRLAA